MIESSCPEETPFFIIGNPRSGTTLLTLILSSHPRLHIPSETGFLPQLTKYRKGNLSFEQVCEIIQTITRQNRDWRGVVMDARTFYDAVPIKTLACILDALYRRQVKKFNAERWGDKTPSYVQYIPQISQIFPDAQFIHMIRDGRDSMLSAMEKWGNQTWYMDPYYLLKNWASNVEAGREAGKKLGDRQYLEINYESLVRKPEENVRLICDFLEEEIHPDMLEHSKLAQKVVSPKGHTEVWQPINTQSVERWKEEMSLFDQKLSSRIVGETLENFGYLISHRPTFSLSDWVRLYSLGARYHLINAFRIILYKTGVLTLNRKKRRP